MTYGTYKLLIPSRQTCLHPGKRASIPANAPAIPANVPLSRQTCPHPGNVHPGKCTSCFCRTLIQTRQAVFNNLLPARALNKCFLFRAPPSLMCLSQLPAPSLFQSASACLNLLGPFPLASDRPNMSYLALFPPVLVFL